MTSQLTNDELGYIKIVNSQLLIADPHNYTLPSDLCG
jgi:hypothetical protein